jgi:hypothetical protein
METAIAFAAGMLLTLIALALEDWTRLSKRRNATLSPEEEFGAAKMFLLTGDRNPAPGSPSWACIARMKASTLLHGWYRKVWSRSLRNRVAQRCFATWEIRFRPAALILRRRPRFFGDSGE